MGSRSSSSHFTNRLKLHVLFVFLDGVGLGPPHSHNPLATDWPGLAQLSRGQCWTCQAQFFHSARHVFRSLDATLGVPGLPQSGTGQTALLTGFNAPRIAGRHYGPFAHSRTRPLLAQYNLFQRLKTRGFSVAFANAYPPPFFAYAQQRDRWSVTTRCCREAGVRLRTLDDLERGEAVAADLTGRRLRTAGFPITPVDESRAARQLLALAQRHDFTLFEYFLTDQAGHRQDASEAQWVLASLDRFFTELVALLDPECHLLVVTSDHGNLEDLRVRTHTRNPVPLFVYGRGATCFRHAHDLRDVTPAIVAALEDTANSSP
ncbi:alkaline phosphatase family protein [Rhodothermus profundi]|uniref:Phosphoglycerate mutase n=1 Tax=Rhodothermus profundi TaxID=633813 RepID=A0A1M6P6Y2_9BACT|nr:alkaline phosphatase family protein [Rhodothermus profundi]SHK03658.1 phosphoglycerate mutase [Rhodothermus profundi]